MHMDRFLQLQTQVQFSNPDAVLVSGHEHVRSYLIMLRCFGVAVECYLFFFLFLCMRTFVIALALWRYSNFFFVVVKQIPSRPFCITFFVPIDS
jgi:hypothetical protein